MSHDDAGPKEIALREMREAKLKRLMSQHRPTKTKDARIETGKLPYAGKDIGNERSSYHTASMNQKLKQAAIPKNKRKKRISRTPRI